MSVSVSLGFGANIIALPIASHFTDVKLVIPVLGLLGCCGSSIMSVKERRHIEWRELGRILLWAGIGFPVGFLGFTRLSGRWLDLLVGVVVTAVAIEGLWAHLTGRVFRSPHPAVGRALLLFGGMTHGAIVTGGPLIVGYAVHAIPDRRRFRATLFALWMTLNFVFSLSYLFGPNRRAEVVGTALVCVPFVLAGLWTGQKVYRRLPESWFRRAVLGLLLVAGISRLFR